MKKQYANPEITYWAFRGDKLCSTTDPIKLAKGIFTAPAPPSFNGSGENPNDY